MDSILIGHTLFLVELKLRYNQVKEGKSGGEIA